MEELGVTVIPAHSPQAKGRIERFWGFPRDRLVVELRLDGARTVEQANKTLARFLRDTVNSSMKLKLTIIKSYGFRTFRVAQIVLYHAPGNIPEPESTHRIC